MNEFNSIPISAGEASEAGKNSDSARSMHGPPLVIDSRLVELEIENSRLHRLVAELLIKNQQLRKPE